VKIGTFFVFEFANNKNILFVFWKAGAAFHFNVRPAFHFKSYPDEKSGCGFPISIRFIYKSWRCYEWLIVWRKKKGAIANPKYYHRLCHLNLIGTNTSATK
jgi:hypothetical protein